MYSYRGCTVYNIETTHGNFFAGGLLVHNSHRCKAPGGKQSMYLSRLRDRATRRLCLTGTPMPHSPLDAYAQYRFLDPGIFGTSFTAFRARYAIMGGFENHQVVALTNQEELTKKFYSIAYRVTADEVLDLPPVQHITQPVKLSREELRVYAALEHDLIAEVKAGVVTVANALVKILRLQQATSGYSRLDAEPGEARGREVRIGDSKERTLADLLDSLPGSEPVVVFARFHHDLDAVARICEAQSRRFGELSGRHNELMDWQMGRLDVLGVQIQSGGVGIDLTRACYAVYYSVGYSLGEYEQSLARLCRPGQERPVRYYHLVATGTVDETVRQALEAKRDVVEAVLANLPLQGVGR